MLGGKRKSHRLTRGGSLARDRYDGERCSSTGCPDLAPVITELQAVCAASVSAIAAGLNERKIPTARGTGTWSAVQVMRVMERANIPAVVAVGDNPDCWVDTAK